MNPVLRKVNLTVPKDTPPATYCLVWCPGCEDMHQIYVEGRSPSHTWEWNGDEQKPTFSPSLLVRGKQWPEDSEFYMPTHPVSPGGDTVCHSFIRGGQWEFLADSTHHLAGQTVEMPPLPDWMLPEREEASDG